MQLKNLENYECVVVKQRTPDGELYLTIVEESPGKPIKIFIEIGKSGSSIRAWTDTVARLCSLFIEKGGTLEQLVNELSNITTGSIVRDANNTEVSSGPDGLIKAILKYKRQVFIELVGDQEIPNIGRFHNR